VYQYPVGQIKWSLVAGKVQTQRNGRDQPEALDVGRIDAIANAVLKEKKHLISLLNILNLISEL